MKKLLILLSAVCVFNLAGAQESKIEYDKIPEAAQKFIKTNFPKVKVEKATTEKDGAETMYTAYFDDGRFVKFGGQGKWREKNFEKDAEKRTLNEKHVPKEIIKYIEDHYKKNPAIVIKKRKNGSFEVKLKDGKLLQFGAKFDFIKEGEAK